MLGLGTGKAGILSQIKEMGLTGHVFGHCFSGRGGGFLFFGDKIVPSSGMTWVPMKSTGQSIEYVDVPCFYVSTITFIRVHLKYVWDDFVLMFMHQYNSPLFSSNHYSLGPAELLFDGQSTGTKGLLMIFDSGSSYTYFNALAYKAVVSAVSDWRVISNYQWK